MSNLVVKKDIVSLVKTAKRKGALRKRGWTLPVYADLLLRHGGNCSRCRGSAILVECVVNTIEGRVTHRGVADGRKRITRFNRALRIEHDTLVLPQKERNTEGIERRTGKILSVKLFDKNDAHDIALARAYLDQLLKEEDATRAEVDRLYDIIGIPREVA